MHPGPRGRQGLLLELLLADEKGARRLHREVRAMLLLLLLNVLRLTPALRAKYMKQFMPLSREYVKGIKKMKHDFTLKYSC